jgi:hypothetical protein
MIYFLVAMIALILNGFVMFWIGKNLKREETIDLFIDEWMEGQQEEKEGASNEQEN